jgi:hypothetical protein
MEIINKHAKKLWKIDWPLLNLCIDYERISSHYNTDINYCKPQDFREPFIFTIFRECSVKLKVRKFVKSNTLSIKVS